MLRIEPFPVPLDSGEHGAREVEEVVRRVDAFAGEGLEDVR